MKKFGLLRQPGGGVCDYNHVHVWGGWLWSRSCKLICNFWLSCRSDLICSRAFICLLTAALRVGVQLQSCNVSVPAQSMNEPWVWGPTEQRKGFLVSLWGTETSQVAAWGEVVVQRSTQRRLLVYLQQEAKLKGCRKRGQMVGHHYLATVKWPQQMVVMKKMKFDIKTKLASCWW